MLESGVDHNKYGWKSNCVWRIRFDKSNELTQRSHRQNTTKFWHFLVVNSLNSVTKQIKIISLDNWSKSWDLCFIWFSGLTKPNSLKVIKTICGICYNKETNANHLLGSIFTFIAEFTLAFCVIVRVHLIFQWAILFRTSAKAMGVCPNLSMKWREQPWHILLHTWEKVKTKSKMMSYLLRENVSAICQYERLS